MSFRVLSLYVCSLLLPFSLFAQVEVNVKLRIGETELMQHLQNNSLREHRATSVSRALQSKAPFLDQVKWINPLYRNDQNSSLSQWFTLRFEDGQSAENWVSQISRSSTMETVEINHSYQLHHIQTDPPRDDSIVLQWYHDYIRTFEAWEKGRGNRNIKIGVVDTGLDYGHPEFEGQIAINTLEDINGNGTFEPWSVDSIFNGLSGDFDGIDNDRNGYVDDVIGYDFTDQPRSPFFGDYLVEDADPFDDNGHGTLVSGIINAKADNGVGGAGVAPGCQVVVLRAFAANGAGDDDDIARAIVYAADNGIQILNFSFGDIYASQMMQEAIRYAASKGVLMVSSAGNATGDNLHYPSGYDEVMSVSASAADLSTGNEFLWPLSSFGLTVDMTAPGSGIFVPVPRDTTSEGEVTLFQTSSGTSTSAPMVAAAAALILSQRPNLSPKQVRGILTSSVDDISDEGWDHYTGAGRLNIERALNVVGGSNVEIVSPQNDAGGAGDKMVIIGTVLDPEFKHYVLEYAIGTESTDDWINILSEQPYQISNDTLASWDISNLPEGEYTLRLRLDKTNGSTAEDRIRFVRDLTPAETEITWAQQAWDNRARKLFFVFRSNDQGQHTLFFRRQGSANYSKQPYDRRTRNGEFLLDQQQLMGPGTYEYFIETENLAGLKSQTPLASIEYDGGSINTSGFNELNYKVPMARFVEGMYDFDGDGLMEILGTEYDERLSLSRVKLYEYQAGRFTTVDSIANRPILIAKDVADTDGNGLLEILASINDSSFVYEQETENTFPSAVIYENIEQDRIAARFADTDADGQEELILKAFSNEDYFVYERSGNSFSESAKLENVSPRSRDSNSPRMIVEDFDGDGKPEMVFSDFDGDMVIHEFVGGGEYQATFIDSTNIVEEEAGTYVTAGDFDGDGRKEIFTLLKSRSKRNSDFEYDPPYLWLRIFDAVADNQYEVVFEDFLYDKDSDTYNAVTAGNIDNDPEEELVITTFPRTYILEKQGNDFGFSWFFFGSLATHHIIGDFNENGIPEIGIGLGDSTAFFEKNLAYQGPSPVTTVRGRVLGSTSTYLEWEKVANARTYWIYRGELIENEPGINFQLLDSTAQTTFVDPNATSGSRYVYLLRTSNRNLSPGLGPFDIFNTNFAVLRPHPRVKVDSILAAGPNQLEIYFDQFVIAREHQKGAFMLNNQHPARSITNAGERKLMLSFPENFTEGFNQLRIDTIFYDAEGAFLDPSEVNQIFNYDPQSSERLYLTNWEEMDDKTVRLNFNLPVSASALDTSNYSISPVGSISEITWADDQEDAVVVKVKDARIGALGYAVSITANEGVCSIIDICMDNEGNTATFSSFKEDLSDVFVYPNPVIRHDQFEGLRFANLTQQATIEVFTVSGRFVNRIEETDGDGGVEWDMRDKGNKRLRPGIYLYRVSSKQEGVKEVLKKFSVVE